MNYKNMPLDSICRCVFNWLILSLCFNFFSCKGKSENEIKINTVKRLIVYLRENNVDEIKDLLGTGVKEVGKSESFIMHDCVVFNVLFKKYGIPSEKNFKLSSETNLLGETFVRVPIFEGRDTITNLLKAELEVTFAPRQILPPEKIVNYRLLSEVDLKKAKFQPLIITPSPRSSH